LNYLILSTVKELEKTDRELSRSVGKWKKLICNLCQSGSKSTGTSSEDFFQDLMVSVWEDRQKYKLELYRYKGNLYEKKRGDSFSSIIKTPDTNKNQKEYCVLNVHLEKVKKSKWNSFFYHMLVQSYQDILNRHYRVKNGYKRVVKSEKLVKIRSGSKGNSYKIRNVDIKVRDFVFMSLSDPVSEDNGVYVGDTLVSDISDPESYAIAMDIHGTVRSSVSDFSRVVLDSLMEKPGFLVTKNAAKDLNVSVPKIMSAKSEIQSKYLKCTNL